jgi:hypothetical protein
MLVENEREVATIVSQKSFVPHCPVQQWDKTFLEIYTQANTTTNWEKTKFTTQAIRYFPNSL